jgi:hypothetical protein
VVADVVGVVGVTAGFTVAVTDWVTRGADGAVWRLAAHRRPSVFPAESV